MTSEELCRSELFAKLVPDCMNVSMWAQVAAFLVKEYVTIDNENKKSKKKLSEAASIMRGMSADLSKTKVELAKCRRALERKGKK